jgi:hypothetical protein
MKLKQIVGLSLIFFVASTFAIIFVGLVVIRPASLAVMTDPVSGAKVSGSATAPDPSNGGKPAASTPAPTAKPVVTVAPTAKAQVPGKKSAPAATSAPAADPAPAPQPVVYCAGQSPCYGVSVLAAHTSFSSCWGYNLTWMINLTAFAPQHPNGATNVLATAFCGKNLAAGLNGTQGDDNGDTHNHKVETKNNTANSLLASYRVGYYDPTMP